MSVYIISGNAFVQNVTHKSLRTAPTIVHGVRILFINKTIFNLMITEMYYLTQKYIYKCSDTVRTEYTTNLWNIVYYKYVRSTVYITVMLV